VRDHGVAPYAAPIPVASIAECHYYHTMDVPGEGLVRGEWDLREGVDAYLGRESVAGKRVLEIGTASGFLCFEMERRGADVVGYDLSSADAWDVVPYAGLDAGESERERREHIARMNKSWWWNHRAFGSRAHVVYGSVYAVPRSIGPIDVCTFGAVLLHLRDPFLALRTALALEPETAIVTELRPPRRAMLRDWLDPRSPRFLPNAEARAPRDAWWSFTPHALGNMLAILGYRTERVVRHAQCYRGRPVAMFTIVARRAAQRVG
jgi:SAM-dependent methyltransferase